MHQKFKFELNELKEPYAMLKNAESRELFKRTKAAKTIGPW